MSTQTEDSAVEDMYIAESIVEARDALLAERDAQIAAAIAPLDAERESLTAEQASIAEASKNLAELLPAKARVAQAEYDHLLLAGDREGAAAKLAEQKEAEHAPEAMKERQREIDLRLAVIDEEKRDIARRAFADWYPKLQSLVRSVEHALFIELLDFSRAEMLSYEQRHDLLGTPEKPAALVKNFHFENLTAPGQTVEWGSASKWYAGRGR